MDASELQFLPVLVGATRLGIPMHVQSDGVATDALQSLQ
jgi:hypothetical protein